MRLSTGTSADARSAADGGPRAAWTAGELRSVWARQQDRVNDRLDVIERALAALADGRLDAALRRDAERAAHTLAGSIGTFGFTEASEAARGLELELAQPTADRAPALAALLLRMRAGVAGPAIPRPGGGGARGVDEGSRSERARAR